MKYLAVVTGLFALAATSGLRAQQAAAPSAPVQQSPSPEVGAMAPDFSLPGATRYGVLKDPVKLSDFRGKTVVLAFFPRARTRGCTIQMHSYRDQYTKLFHAGQNVVLIAISVDQADTLAAWARDDQFQFLMASDVDNLATARQYGAVSSRGTSAARNLFIIGPDGRIASKMVPFREVDPTSYVELAAAVDKTIPPAPAEPAKGG